jgi:levanase
MSRRDQPTRRHLSLVALLAVLAVSTASAGVASSASAATTSSTTYKELYRPQFHYTPAKNWMNDPGSVPAGG